VRGLTIGPSQTRKALLPIGALFADRGIRAAFRAALKDQDMRSAAARALCATRDVALLPDLLEVARLAPEPTLRSMAIDGCVRLATEEGTALAIEQQAEQAETLAAAFAIADRSEDKRSILSGLSRVPHRASLDLAERSCADPALAAHAEFACLQICRGLAPSDLAAVEPVLTRLAAGTVNPPVQRRSSTPAGSASAPIDGKAGKVRSFSMWPLPRSNPDPMVCPGSAPRVRPTFPASERST
jgi:hypothetical protein